MRINRGTYVHSSAAWVTDRFGREDIMTSGNMELKKLKRMSDRAGVNSLPIEAHNKVVSRELSSIFNIIM